MTISAPQNRVTIYSYDENGNKKTETVNGHTTQYDYDELNRLKTIHYPTVPETTKQYTYDFRNNIINITDELGHITHHEYDLAGRLVAKTMADSNHTTTYAYDEAGRPRSTANSSLAALS